MGSLGALTWSLPQGTQRAEGLEPQGLWYRCLKCVEVKE